MRDLLVHSLRVRVLLIRMISTFFMGVGGEAVGGLQISCAFGQRQFRCIRVVVVSRYAGCYPLQDFTSMSPAEKNDWEYA